MSAEQIEDIEVILRLYEKFGISFLNKLNGMFAIAIYDLKTISSKGSCWRKTTIFLQRFK
ncbi:MAG: hypothetical protein CM15mP19_00040 [Gammaproteobacteria bacterium]|nr:MAG: hypothetical protein CM15mP19_00040 [Gammaproteobacteria bacterium]